MFHGSCLLTVFCPVPSDFSHVTKINFNYVPY
jgi:hypothetical protein